VSAFGTRRDESRKNVWTDNVEVNSYVTWTFNTGLCSTKLHLELSIISTTGKIKLFLTLKQKRVVTWSRLALGFFRGASECVCSSQLPSGSRSSLALRILPCITECEGSERQLLYLLPRMEIRKALRKGANRETDAQDSFFKRLFQGAGLGRVPAKYV